MSLNEKIPDSVAPAPGDAPKISIVIPVYNEQAILHAAVIDLRERLEPFGWKYEILLAENGSRDETLVIAAELSQKYPEVRFFSHGEPPRSAEGRTWATQRKPMLGPQNWFYCLAPAVTRIERRRRSTRGRKSLLPVGLKTWCEIADRSCACATDVSRRAIIKFQPQAPLRTKSPSSVRLDLVGRLTAWALLTQRSGVNLNSSYSFRVVKS